MAHIAKIAHNKAPIPKTRKKNTAIICKIIAMTALMILPLNKNESPGNKMAIKIMRNNFSLLEFPHKHRLWE